MGNNWLGTRTRRFCPEGQKRPLWLPKSNLCCLAVAQQLQRPTSPLWARAAAKDESAVGRPRSNRDAGERSAPADFAPLFSQWENGRFAAQSIYYLLAESKAEWWENDGVLACGEWGLGTGDWRLHTFQISNLQSLFFYPLTRKKFATIIRDYLIPFLIDENGRLCDKY